MQFQNMEVVLRDGVVAADADRCNVQGGKLAVEQFLVGSVARALVNSSSKR